jgi:predicted Zn-dependent peptidase
MFRKQVLDNGLTLLTERMEHVPSVTVGVWLKRGSRHETANESGLAHFIEHMVFKGTERRSQARIAQEMDEIGGQTDAFTSQEYAGFHAKVLGEDLPRAVDLLSDIVLAPRFDADELERERMVIFEEIRSVEDTPEELVHEMFCESFWPNHPLGRPILGTPETVGSFHRDDLVEFFRRTYAPSNIIVAAAGQLDHEAVTDLVTSHFAALRTPPDNVTETPPRVESTVRVQDKDLEQAHLVLGTVGPRSASPDRFAAYVLNAVLGGNLSSRLFQVIREEHGLAYSVYSGLSSYQDCGQLTVYAGTNPKNVGEVLDLTLRELSRIKAEPIPDAELSRAKAHLRGSTLMGLESTGARMSRMARQEMTFGKHIPVEDALVSFEAVTSDDVLRLAGEIFDQRPLAMTLLGKNAQLDPKPELLVA